MKHSFFASMGLAALLLSCAHSTNLRWVETNTGAPVIARLDATGKTEVWMKEWPDGPLLINNGAILTALVLKDAPVTRQMVWEQRDPAGRDESRHAEFDAWMAKTAAELGEETSRLQEVVVLRESGPVYYHLGKFSKQEQPVAFEWKLVAKGGKGHLWTEVEVHPQASLLPTEQIAR